ncbi:hypothetical protein AABB24_015780, partial [Solanum stoloniferum]
RTIPIPHNTYNISKQQHTQYTTPLPIPSSSHRNLSKSKNPVVNLGATVSAHTYVILTSNRPRFPPFRSFRATTTPYYFYCCLEKERGDSKFKRILPKNQPYSRPI